MHPLLIIEAFVWATAAMQTGIMLGGVMMIACQKLGITRFWRGWEKHLAVGAIGLCVLWILGAFAYGITGSVLQ